MYEASAAALEPSTTELEAAHALVVDDDATNRLILRGLLSRLGYRVTECVNGAEAVAVSRDGEVDIIFMDVMMPVLDGISATRAIKARQQQRFVPIIFLTSLSDEATVARCLDAGGDDFLAKPYSVAVLRAKVAALMRIQALQDRVTTMHAQQVRDEQIAERLFSRVVSANNFQHGAICAVLRPAARFSGDVYLAARAPSGEIYILLGDFTGHGLAAAIGALPVSEVFRAMTAKGFAPEQILRSINRKLNALFPTGMFMAAHFIAIDAGLSHIRVANCGMPDLMVFDADGSQPVTAIVAHSLALGITTDMFLRDGMRTLPIHPGTRIMMASDGLFEAVAPDGTAFGGERVMAAMRTVADGGRHGLPRVMAELESFCGAAPQADDITAVEILVDPSLADRSPAAEGPRAGAATALRRGWDLELTLRGGGLAEVDPVPLLLNQIHELAAVETQHSGLFTVLTELFVNALDHGVLGLDSSLKSGRNGFEQYMNERAQRLAAMEQGWVRIAVRAKGEGDGASLDIEVADSGTGFDVDAYHAARVRAEQADAPRPYGRGLALVKALCASVEHDARGATVRVTLPWQSRA